MKIRVSVTVDIDPETYASEFGLSLDSVRADVQNHAQQVVLTTFADYGFDSGGG